MNTIEAIRLNNNNKNTLILYYETFAHPIPFAILGPVDNGFQGEVHGRGTNMFGTLLMPDHSLSEAQHDFEIMLRDFGYNVPLEIEHGTNDDDTQT